MKITSKIILDALRSKHWKDVFVSECKSGSSYGGHWRMDAWIMAKSWAHPQCTAYEIKVDRGDFLNDNKFHNYLQFCNEFYFVCPSKLILPNEIPDDCGLMWISSTGTRLYTKKKAKYRKIDSADLEDVFRYILMCRIDVTTAYSEYRPDLKSQDIKQFWEDWLINKEICQSLGYRVSKGLRQTIDEKIIAVENENKKLSSKMEKYDDIRELLTKLDIEYSSYAGWGLSIYSVKEKIKEFQKIISSDVERKIRHSIETLTHLENEIQKQKNQLKGEKDGNK